VKPEQSRKSGPFAPNLYGTPRSEYAPSPNTPIMPAMTMTVPTTRGTRTASITASYVALALAIRKLRAAGTLAEDPLVNPVAAVSVGIVEGRPLLDLNYVEDSSADVDLNLVMTARGEFIEVQGTGERGTFTDDQLAAVLTLGKAGIRQLIAAQQTALA